MIAVASVEDSVLIWTTQSVFGFEVWHELTFEEIKLILTTSLYDNGLPEKQVGSALK